MPSGYFCPKGSKNNTALVCRVGGYCPTGSPVPTLCPRGRYNALTAKTAASDCLFCPAGTWSNTAGVSGCGGGTGGLCSAGYYCPPSKNDLVSLEVDGATLHCVALFADTLNYNATASTCGKGTPLCLSSSHNCYSCSCHAFRLLLPRRHRHAHSLPQGRFACLPCQSTFSKSECACDIRVGTVRRTRFRTTSAPGCAAPATSVRASRCCWLLLARSPRSS